MIVMLYETARIIESTNISRRSTVEGVVFVQKEYVLCEADSSKGVISAGGIFYCANHFVQGLRGGSVFWE
jgi:hypothetical protein